MRKMEREDKKFFIVLPRLLIELSHRTPCQDQDGTFLGADDPKWTIGFAGCTPSNTPCLRAGSLQIPGRGSPHISERPRTREWGSRTRLSSPFRVLLALEPGPVFLLPEVSIVRTIQTSEIGGTGCTKGLESLQSCNGSICDISGI